MQALHLGFVKKTDPLGLILLLTGMKVKIREQENDQSFSASRS